MKHVMAGSTRSLPMILTGMLLAFTGGCATPINYEASQEAGVDIAGFSTFRISSPAVESGMQPGRAQAQRVIDAAIKDALVAKGYQPVASGEDFVVEYIIFSESVYQEGGHDRFYFDDRVRLLSGSEAQLANPVQIGTLHLHFMFPESGRPFFEAIASEVIEQRSLDEGHVRRAVRRMLAGLPESTTRQP